MKRMIMLLPLLAACAPLTAQQPAPSPVIPQPLPSTIVASATGTARLAPDRALLEVGVQTRAATAAAASALNARRQRAIIDTLKVLGIPSELISTSNFSVYPEMRQVRPNDEQTQIIGYNVNNTVRVEIRRTDQVGPIIDAVLANGANMINSLNFFSSNPDDARRKAMAEAVSRARQDAETLARAAGGSLGSLVELSSAEYNQGPRPLAGGMMMRAQADVAPTPISPGELEVHVTVFARWHFTGTR